ncbi:MAG: ABC transporter ATP-binding protein [Candidatus Aminicenantes bacterium]|nr:ABC transporter ATP-binding protein [Candidatus Aminicenantes bacterium]
MTEKMLTATGLCKRYGRIIAVTDATFSVLKGGITTFLGENGAGKTTIIKIILGFLKSDSGRVQMRAARIGYVPEHPVFFGWLNGKDILSYTARAHGIGHSALRDLVETFSEKIAFDLELLSRNVRTYSLGNKKKFSFLQSLIIDPDFFIVDEPFNSLDPHSIKKVRDLFLEMKREGKTLFLSSHIISEVEKISDDFIIIKKGRILLQENLNIFKDRFIYVEIKDSSLKLEELRTISPYVKGNDSELVMLMEKSRLESMEDLLKTVSCVKKHDLDLEKVFLFFTE